MMLEGFELAHLRITLLPETEIHLPAFNKGNVLRGAFGSSLRKLVCTDLGMDCSECMLRSRCAYSLVFNPLGLAQAKRLQNPPRGYVFKPPLSETALYTPSTPLRFDLVLIGDRIDYFPYIIMPFIEVGKSGIGLNRGRFRLAEIASVKDGTSSTVYDSRSGVVTNSIQRITGRELLKKADDLASGRMTLRFLTPTRLKYNPTGEKGKSAVVRDPEFHHIIRRLRDRLNALSSAYCGGPLDMDFKGLAERAMMIKKARSDARWVETRRKSRTQQATHDQSGFMGRISFEGDLEEFIPMLIAGEFVHIGDDAVFGNGWYKVE